MVKHTAEVNHSMKVGGSIYSMSLNQWDTVEELVDEHLEGGYLNGLLETEELRW